MALQLNWLTTSSIPNGDIKDSNSPNLTINVQQNPLGSGNSSKALCFK